MRRDNLELVGARVGPPGEAQCCRGPDGALSTAFPFRDGVIDVLAGRIEGFYDAQRLHSSLGYRAPTEVER